MFNKITRIGRKLLEELGEIDWDNFKKEIDPLLNKKMELYKYIEKSENKQQSETCDLEDGDDE